MTKTIIFILSVLSWSILSKEKDRNEAMQLPYEIEIGKTKLKEIEPYGNCFKSFTENNKPVGCWLFKIPNRCLLQLNNKGKVISASFSNHCDSLILDDTWKKFNLSFANSEKQGTSYEEFKNTLSHFNIDEIKMDSNIAKGSITTYFSIKEYYYQAQFATRDGVYQYACNDNTDQYSSKGLNKIKVAKTLKYLN